MYFKLISCVGGIGWRLHGKICFPILDHCSTILYRLTNGKYRDHQLVSNVINHVDIINYFCNQIVIIILLLTTTNIIILWRSSRSRTSLQITRSVVHVSIRCTRELVSGDHGIFFRHRSISGIGKHGNNLSFFRVKDVRFCRLNNYYPVVVCISIRCRCVKLAGT